MVGVLRDPGRHQLHGALRDPLRLPQPGLLRILVYVAVVARKVASTRHLDHVLGDGPNVGPAADTHYE